MNYIDFHKIVNWLAQNGYKISINGQWYGPYGKVNIYDIYTQYERATKAKGATH